jgi:hypothetical protein
MPATKITELTAISTVNTTVDPLAIVDVSDTTQASSGTTKKITVSQIDAAIFGSSGSKAIVVDNVAALKALTVSGITDGQLYITRGYYSDNDGGQGTYIYDSASAASDNGGTVIAPTAGSGRFLLQYSGPVNVLQWGAKNTNSDASITTAAIQAAVSFVTTNQKKAFFPKGIYLLNDSIKIAGQTSRWSLEGESRQTTLLQSVVTGDSMPIFEFQGGEISEFNISNFFCQWDTIASVTGYKGCAFFFTTGTGSLIYGVYNFTIENIFSVYGFRFFSNYNLSSSTSSGTNIWGATLRKISTSYMRGGSIVLANAGSGGHPNFDVQSFYVIGKTDGQPVSSSPYTYSEPIFYFNGGVAGLKFSDVEINNVSTTSYLFSIVGGPGSSCVFESSRVENVRFKQNYFGALDLFNIGTTINGLDYSAVYVDAGIATQLIKFTSNDGSGHKLAIVNLDNQNNPSYPTINLGAGASIYIVDATPGSISLVGNFPPALNANRYAQAVPNINGVQQFNFTSYAYTNTYTPYASYNNEGTNVFRIFSPGPTLTINAVSGANVGSEYIFIIKNDLGTLTAINWNAAYLTDGSTVPSVNAKFKTVRFVYDGTNFIQIGAPSGNI